MYTRKKFYVGIYFDHGFSFKISDDYERTILAVNIYVGYTAELCYNVVPF